MTDAQPDAAAQIATSVAAWPGVTAVRHSRGGLEFRLGGRELGHLHGSRIADLPFPRRVRDELIAAGRAQRHHHLPDSGWVTVPLDRPSGVQQAVGLFRLSYERAQRAQQARTRHGLRGRSTR